MARVNESFFQLPKNYLFADIARKVAQYKALHPDSSVISLGIGDVTQPLCPAVIEALHKATEEMAAVTTFRGYGPEQGYEFLRRDIATHDFKTRGIAIEPDEIFISDGAKSDTGNIQELFCPGNTIGLTDPVYPVYLDSNVMSGRASRASDTGDWDNIVLLPCTAENNFVAPIPNKPLDVVYLCYPNNPTGAVLTYNQLKAWVDYALENNTLILYDAAYEAYIQETSVPHSIYEIDGAQKCAIEFHSYSKTAGFTGIRCGYTVVPHEVCATTSKGQRMGLNDLWRRRQCTKFNGASFISQRAAQAIYTPEGRAQVKAQVDYYMANAAKMLTAFRALDFTVCGGKNAPYVWMRTPKGITSWEFFETMLNEAEVVCTPGVGFGPNGEGYVRFTAFGTHENTNLALARLQEWLQHKV